MKPIYKKLLLWSLLVLHICLIFSFSLQNADESTVISRGLTEKVKPQEKFEENIREEMAENGEKPPEDKVMKMKAKSRFIKLEGFFRKCAHMTLFFILGILIILILRTYKFGVFYSAAVSVLFAATVGIFDETIQLTSAGRAGTLYDIMIDALGAIIASTLYIVGRKLYEKNQKKRPEMDS